MNGDRRFLATLIFEHSAHYVGAAARLYRVSARVRAWWDALLPEWMRIQWTWKNVKWCLVERVRVVTYTMYEVLISYACQFGDSFFVATMLSRKYGNNPIARHDYERYWNLALSTNNHDVLYFIYEQLTTDDQRP